MALTTCPRGCVLGGLGRSEVGVGKRACVPKATCPRAATSTPWPMAVAQNSLRLPTKIPVPNRYGLDHVPKSQAASLYARFVAFEKQHGDRQGIEDVVVSKRRWAEEGGRGIG